MRNGARATHAWCGTGSFFDIPLFAAMASLTWIALRTKAEKLESDACAGSSAYGLWVHTGDLFQFFAERNCQIAHRIEIGLPGLVNPAQHLPGAEGLFALFRKPGSQLLHIKVEEVCCHKY